LTFNVRLKPIASFDAAGPMITSSVKTDLVSLWRIDAFKAHFRCANYQRVTVNYPRYPRNIPSFRD
jgi:hypothetical protein